MAEFAFGRKDLSSRRRIALLTIICADLSASYQSIYQECLMNIENASHHIDDQDRSEDGAAEDEQQMEQQSEDEADRSELDEPAADQQMGGIAGEEFQGALSSVGEAVRQVGESSEWEAESERLIRKVTDSDGQMG
ncbi:MAG: hypothetical protein WCK94_07865 [Comamonadaceae bacterium]